MSKTPGGQQPSAKYEKRQAEAEGAGAPNAPGRTEPTKPLEQPEGRDGGFVDNNVGITELNNNSTGKSGGLNTEGTFGTTQVGSGAPTANIPPEQRD